MNIILSVQSGSKTFHVAIKAFLMLEAYPVPRSSARG